MANLTTIQQEGCFDATVRTQVNSNLSNMVAGTIASNETQQLTLLSGSSDAIPNTVPGGYIVTTAGVDAMTLAAPPTSSNGAEIYVISNTANAHTITATGLFMTGGAASPYTTATFAAKTGASLSLMAYGGKWAVMSSPGITFS